MIDFYDYQIIDSLDNQFGIKTKRKFKLTPEKKKELLLEYDSLDEYMKGLLDGMSLLEPYLNKVIETEMNRDTVI